MLIHKLQMLPDWLIQFVLVIVSASVGYLLSIIIDQLPKTIIAEEPFSLASLRSFGPYRRKKIPWHNHLPLLHYFFSKGKTHHQGSSGASRLLIELVTILVSLILYQVLGLHSEFFASLLLAWWCIALVVIDIKYYLLPDQLTLSLLWIGLLINLHHFFTPLPEAVLGVFLGYGLLWLLDIVYYWVRKKNGIGPGDWKLLAALGAWFGYHAVFYILIIAVILATIVGIIGILRKKMRLQTSLPFGPFLCVAGLGYLFLAKDVILL